MKMTAASQEGELAKRKYKDESQSGDIRTPFQHDRDRVIHSTAFRRLQYKTQVYAIHEGDLYRTRLTHSLEVAQIARGIAYHLGADPDLAEAISVAHDLGHAPFGHTGENKLRDLLAQFGIPFDHNVQSYRIVTELEERYTEFKGLNLTHATLEGILRHCTFFDP
jgi:dGTPase